MLNIDLKNGCAISGKKYRLEIGSWSLDIHFIYLPFDFVL